jgi:shikimate kinase
MHNVCTKRATRQCAQGRACASFCGTGPAGFCLLSRHAAAAVALTGRAGSA